ncbi:Tyrosine recombinase XerD [subsurface metagenome]
MTPIRDLKEYLEPGHIKSLIAATTNPRDRAFIALLARSGIRISEAIQLKVNDIDFKRGTLTILHLKERSRLKCSHCGESLGRRHLFCPSCGNKVDQVVRQKIEQRRQRTIPVDPATLGFMDEYLQWRRSFPYRGPLVFPFGRQRGWQLVRRAGERIGIRGLHPHSLRHLLATTWVAKSLNVKKLQVLLGHASISTTMEYVDSNLEQLRCEYEKLWQNKEDETTETKDYKGKERA